ncbi:MAG: 3-dehydroquinate synthase, partial [Oscillospiraceae bacterium]|nr:3-dehydroquinate synthase [Oscillospiraceae bacterium]
RRPLLNFGHTFGHSIEKCSGYSLHHGQAVAMGMCIAAAGGVAMDMCGEDTFNTIRGAVRAYGLPERCEYDEQRVFDAMLADKKRAGDSLVLILPEKTGSCVRVKLPLDKAHDVLHAGMERSGKER